LYRDFDLLLCTAAGVKNSELKDYEISVSLEHPYVHELFVLVFIECSQHKEYII